MKIFIQIFLFMQSEDSGKTNFRYFLGYSFQKPKGNRSGEITFIEGGWGMEGGGGGGGQVRNITLTSEHNFYSKRDTISEYKMKTILS